jgi:hypothetical protein
MHSAESYTSAYSTIQGTNPNKNSKFHKMFIKLEKNLNNFLKTPRLKALHIPLLH